MILLDTSVLIAYLRTRDPRLAALFTAHDAAICGVTRAEVLSGVRSPADRAYTTAVFAILRPLPTPESTWDALGDNLAALRAEGLPMPFPDVLIATLAVAAGVELWTRDRHFALMGPAVPGLRLFAEPP